ncbi:MAG: PilZ domain-containing protein [Anaerolineales bacterium]|jgi:hypothetical protein
MPGIRKYPRSVVVGMGVTVKTLFHESVKLLDISIGGASIRSSRRFHMGGEYVFKFDLKGRFVSVKGVIVWEKLSGTKKISEEEVMPVYTAGIKFTDVVTDAALELRQFLVDKLKERRVAGVRLKFHTPESTLLSFKEDCVVKDLSIGGMQIVMGQKPSVETACSFDLVLAGNENPVHGEGKVAYCIEPTEEIPQGYWVGVEFLEMGEEDKLRVSRFLERLPTGNE